MFGFKIMGAGYRPHLVSTCIRRCPDGWHSGRAIDWVDGASYRARKELADAR
jgi:hypothetical protein